MALEDLRAFLTVVEQGSVAAAAKSLDFARETLNKQLDALEESVGTPLLDRARGGVSLTRTGEVLAERGRRALLEVNALWDAAKNLKGETPTVGLEIPVGLSPSFEQALYGIVRRAAPFLRFRITYTDGNLKSNTEAWVALHSQPNSDLLNFRTHRVARLDRVLQASSSYLETHGTPLTLEDLTTSPLLFATIGQEDGRHLPLKDGAHYPVKPALITPNAFFTRKLASAGSGIAFAPKLPPLLGTLSEEAKLVSVLESLVGDSTDLWFSVRKRDLLPAVDALAQALGRFLSAVMGTSTDTPSAAPP